MDVVVVGSANLDVVLEVDELPRPGTTSLARARREGPGGKGLNQAVAAARAGAATGMVAATGGDAARSLLLTELEDAGVAVDLVRVGTAPTGTAFVFVDAHGENSIVVDAGANAGLTALTSDDLAAVRTAAVVLCQLEVPVQTVIAALTAAQGLTILNAAPAQALPSDVLTELDVLVVNEHEALVVSGAHDLEQAVAALTDRVPEVVVTLGANGALVALRGHELLLVPGLSPRQVVDTTGAGDTFCGAYAAARARGEASPVAVLSAVRAATLSVERAGAARSSPTRTEVLDRWPEG